MLSEGLANLDEPKVAAARELCSVKKANPMWLHTVCFHLYTFFKKTIYAIILFFPLIIDSYLCFICIIFKSYTLFTVTTKCGLYSPRCTIHPVSLSYTQQFVRPAPSFLYCPAVTTNLFPDSVRLLRLCYNTPLACWLLLAALGLRCCA